MAALLSLEREEANSHNVASDEKLGKLVGRSWTRNPGRNALYRDAQFANFTGIESGEGNLSG